MRPPPLPPRVTGPRRAGRTLGLAGGLALGLLALPGALIAQPAPEQAAAEALWQAGEREASLERLVALLADHPDDRELRAMVAERQMLVHHYQAALATAQADPERLGGIVGRALYLLGRHEEALAHLRRDDPLEAVLRVDAHAILGHHQETWAELALAEQVVGAGDARLASQRGRLLAAEGRHAEALASFDQALARDPLAMGALYGRGQALLRLGRREEGLQVMERHRHLVPLVDRLDFALRAVDLAPRHASTLAQLGDVRRDLGQLELALAAYEGAAAAASDGEVVPVALRHARLLAEDLGRVDEAVAVLHAAHARQGDVRLLVRAGDLLGAAGRWSEAAEALQAALLLRPQDEQIQRRLGEALRKAGDPAAPP